MILLLDNPSSALSLSPRWRNKSDLFIFYFIHWIKRSINLQQWIILNSLFKLILGILFQNTLKRHDMNDKPTSNEKTIRFHGFCCTYYHSRNRKTVDTTRRAYSRFFMLHFYPSLTFDHNHHQPPPMKSRSWILAKWMETNRRTA